MELILVVISFVLFALLYALIELIRVLKKQIGFYNDYNRVNSLMIKLSTAIDELSEVKMEIEEIKNEECKLGLD